MRILALVLVLVFLFESFGLSAERRIQAGDRIAVSFFDNEDLNMQATVPASGEVLFKLIGKMVVAGLTPSELEKKLTEKYSAYVRQPKVAVVVLSLAEQTRRVYVLEGVREPGAYALPEAGEMTLLQLISAAGGLLKDADGRQIRILRKASKTGKRQILIKNVDELIRPETPTADFGLQADDVVVVPRTGYIDVVGEVNSPGSLPVEVAQEPTLTHILILAGGYTSQADLSRVEIIRGGKRETVDLGSYLFDGKGKDTVLKPGDTVFVPTALPIHIFGAVEKPGMFPYPVGQKLTLTEALSMAGGFSESADLRHIRILRTGEGSSLVVDLRKTVLGEEESEKEFRIYPGDSIIVPELRPVYVHGEVKKAGMYYPAVGEKLTVSRVIAMAGGFGESPLMKSIQIRRLQPDGSFRVIKVDLRPLYRKGDTSCDVEVKPGDEVFVPESIWGGGP